MIKSRFFCWLISLKSAKTCCEHVETYMFVQIRRQFWVNSQTFDITSIASSLRRCPVTLRLTLFPFRPWWRVVLFGVQLPSKWPFDVENCWNLWSEIWAILGWPMVTYGDLFSEKLVEAFQILLTHTWIRWLGNGRVFLTPKDPHLKILLGGIFWEHSLVVKYLWTWSGSCKCSI